MAERNDDFPTLISTKQAAQLVAMTPKGFTSLIARKKGPPVYRIGDRFRIDKAELLEWVRSRAG